MRIVKLVHVGRKGKTATTIVSLSAELVRQLYPDFNKDTLMYGKWEVNKDKGVLELKLLKPEEIVK
ncbi:MAG: hypothetical protein ACPL3B_06210 [Fervidobacterium sp.]